MPLLTHFLSLPHHSRIFIRTRTHNKQSHPSLFPFNSSFLASLQNISDSCGYTDYLDQFLTYPPAGPLPLPNGTGTGTSALPECRLHSPVQRAIQV